MDEDDITKANLIEKINEMMASLAKFRKNTAEAKLLIKNDAAREIVDVIHEVYDSKKRN
jgi:UDP-N-acetylglucosamine:LPS N-acetylglucosamine transferase